jgi:UDP-N-acetylglucosamine diphosphorylase/glucosamine-1-phosphate N-acetyltransferase
MQICFFEDNLTGALKPLTLTRPSNELRVGVLKINEKWNYLLQASQVSQILAPRMKGIFPTPALLDDVDCIWINGRFMPSGDILEQIKNLNIDEGLTFKNIPVVIKMSGKRSSGQFNAGNVSISEVSFEDTESGVLISHPWQVFAFNDEEIKKDIALLSNVQELNQNDYPGVVVSGLYKVYSGKNVTIEPGVIFITSDGPIYLGDDCEVMAGSLLRGPVAICEHASIKMGAKIYGGTTIGPYCKVGGELNNVVFQAYSNKAHDGFLGNAAIGEWCNFGADTNNSNLKNNYSTVRLTDWESGREYDTELQFCGLIMGDHSKTAINSVLNTGTVCGVSSNLFSGKFPPKVIRSFKWIGPEGEEVYKFDKAMETAERMMKRRGIPVTPEYRAMMRHLFEKNNA